MNRNESYQKPYRSFFWPVIIMGVGVIWLLVNLGILPSTNLWILLRLWPVLIILAGLDVLFARRLSFLGALLALLLLGGVIFILINGESLNLGEKPEPIIQSISAPLDDAETAHFELTCPPRRRQSTHWKIQTIWSKQRLGIMGNWITG